MEKKEKILIVGAGLCGSLLSIRLAQRGYKIQLYEKRSDLRKTNIGAGRSINLALSDRGMKGMRLVGIQEKVEKLCIPMHGRMIHDMAGKTFLNPYSGRKNEYINSISRSGLNGLLLSEAETLDDIDIRFNCDCQHTDLENGTATFYDFETKTSFQDHADLIIATDGAGSAVRKSMFLEGNFLFSFSQNFLSYGYKELSFPPGPGGSFLTEKGALHIWPRGENMMIALPNLDGSFTVTLFLPYRDGAYNFENLNTPEKITTYFKTFFPDALELMPDLVEEFNHNPVGSLGTVKCSPWSCYGKVLLMGDAAHAIVPFYGQGMNAAFEDVVELDRILDQFENKNNGKTDWSLLLKTYESSRKKDTDAIADLALDNFEEMKSHTANELFQQKRVLETAFEAEFPLEYFSKYSLVTFNETISYSEAMKIGRAQDKAMLTLIANGSILPEDSLREKLNLVQKETEKILLDQNISKSFL